VLTLVKNRINSVFSKGLGVLIGVMVLVGFGIPYFGFGAGSTASALDTVVAVNVTNPAAVGTSATYVYTQMSLHDAYPYYIAASFMVAAGLSAYGLSYIPSRATQRSRYVSRFETWARTTY
jgi:hypothetical protein